MVDASIPLLFPEFTILRNDSTLEVVGVSGDAGLPAAWDSAALMLEEAARMTVRKTFDERAARVGASVSGRWRIVWTSLGAALLGPFARSTASFWRFSHPNELITLLSG
jgi:hypothetical protein